MGAVSDAERAKIAARHPDIPSDTLERATDITISLELAQRISGHLNIAIQEYDQMLNEHYTADFAEMRSQAEVVARWFMGSIRAWECRCSWVNQANESRCANCDSDR